MIFFFFTYIWNGAYFCVDWKKKRNKIGTGLGDIINIKSCLLHQTWVTPPSCEHLPRLSFIQWKVNLTAPCNKNVCHEGQFWDQVGTWQCFFFFFLDKKHWRSVIMSCIFFAYIHARSSKLKSQISLRPSWIVICNFQQNLQCRTKPQTLHICEWIQ